jgi:DNA-binding LacI/PurR family transcriptional regulator
VVTQHLWNHGARRIAFVARRRSASTMVDRVSGYQFALGECGSRFPARALFGDVEDLEFVRLSSSFLADRIRPLSNFPHDSVGCVVW